MGCKMPLKPHPPPPEDFNSLTLPVSTVSKRDYYRLNNSSYDSAIYFDKSGDGRFDEPSLSYGICYVGESLEAAFIECFGRDLGIRFVSEELLRMRNLFVINNERELKLVNLFGSGLAQLGMDSRVTGGGDYELSRSWSEAIYNHPDRVDGIRYYSRHDNTRLCCGLFDRTSSVLKENNQGNLIDNYTERLADLLDLYKFGLG